MKWVKAGLCVTLKSANQSRHLWIVLTEPAGDPLGVAIVNLTSQKNIPNEPLVLDVGDHSFIKGKTVVNYGAGKTVPAAQLEGGSLNSV